MSDDVFRRAHAPAQDTDYHSRHHSETVRQFAYRAARARGHGVETARFLSEVGMLHDWDPERPHRSKPRVPATIRALEDDFSRTVGLIEGESSFLRDRLGWTRQHLDIAIAIIQRSEYPFKTDHPSNAYGTADGPTDRYQEMLRKMDTSTRDFVLREAPLFAEWADKGSTYMSKDFDGAFTVIANLVHEERATGGPDVTFESLNPGAFLGAIGSDESLAFDRALIEKFKSSVTIPGRIEMLRMLPSDQVRRLLTNRRALTATVEALRSGKSLDEARVAGKRAAVRASSRRGFGVLKKRRTGGSRLRLRRGAGEQSRWRVTVKSKRRGSR